MTDEPEPIVDEAAKESLVPGLDQVAVHELRLMKWRYRLYRLQRYQSHWKVVSLIPRLGFGLPISFQWTHVDDVIGLKRYIDLLIASRTAEALYFEQIGAATAVKLLSHEEEKGLGVLRVDFRAFLSFLELRDDLEIPLWRKISFVTDGKRLVPAQFIAMLAEIPGLEALGREPQKWHLATEEDLKGMGLSPEDVHSGMYQHQPPLREEPKTPESEALAAKQPREVQVDRVLHEKYFELISQVDDEGPRYYVRRLALYDGGQLWAGTSYQVTGPWTEYFRDNAQLMALGLTI